MTGIRRTFADLPSEPRPRVIRDGDVVVRGFIPRVDPSWVVPCQRSRDQEHHDPGCGVTAP